MAGGKRIGAGRKKGSKNKAVLERQRVLQEAHERIVAVVGNVFEGDAHTLLMMVYKNLDLPYALRADAAKACLPYEKPRLATVEHRGSEGHPLAFEVISGVVRHEPDDDRPAPLEISH